MIPSPVRLVTMVDERYLPGLIALLESLQRLGNCPAGLCISVVYCGKQLPPVTSKIRTHYAPQFNVDWRLLDEVARDAGVAALEHGGSDQARFATALQKLLVFSLDVEEPCLFVDADVICLNPIPWTELSACEADFAAVEDQGFGAAELINGSPMLNTGVFKFRPSAELFGRLMDFYQKHPERFRRLGDQVGLNHFFSSMMQYSVKVLPSYWNVLKRRHLREGTLQDEPVFLHYVGRKPWQPAAPWNWREWGYAPLDRRWHLLFQLSSIHDAVGPIDDVWENGFAGPIGLKAARGLFAAEQAVVRMRRRFAFVDRSLRMLRPAAD